VGRNAHPSLLEEIMHKEAMDIIDEFERRLDEFPDKSEWQKTNMAGWYPWLIEEGPRIVYAYRELTGILSLVEPGQLQVYVDRWKHMLDLIDENEAFELAIKLKKKKIID
jgi:hypothetical protein